MQEQPTPRSNHASRRFSDEEANEIYKRAAEIESKTLFLDERLTGEQVEQAANAAGISDEAVNAAIAQIEREQQEAKTVLVSKAKKRGQILTISGIIVGLIAINGVLNQRGLSARMATVDSSRANVETTLQRRQDLLPNIQRLAKANLAGERELIAALSKPNVDGATIELARQKLENRGVQNGALDEIAGTENRIAVARRRFNESASEYNRNASSFPTSVWRGVFRFPARVDLFAADKSAQTAPTLD
ncbi:LemA family protein [bacterium]|nr:MAG: LemA family protein [bacterium]